MAAARPKPRETLAKNLKVLLELHEMSGPDVAKKAGVDIKTVNNMINGRYDPRPEKVDLVARVFGMSAWQLLIPNLPGELLRRDGRLEKLIHDYGVATEEGRDNIDRVADMAARYTRG